MANVYRGKSSRIDCVVRFDLNDEIFAHTFARWVIIIVADQARYRSVLINRRALSLDDLYNRLSAIDGRHNLSLSPGENLIGAGATYIPN